MTFTTMTDVIPTIIKAALPGYNIQSDEGLELEQYRDKYTSKANRQVYINLKGANPDDRYTDGEALLTFSYDVYIHSDQDTADIILRVTETLLEYSSKCRVILNGGDFKVFISDAGATVLNINEKWIHYGVEIYV